MHVLHSGIATKFIVRVQQFPLNVAAREFERLLLLLGPFWILAAAHFLPTGAAALCFPTKILFGDGHVSARHEGRTS